MLKNYKGICLQSKLFFSLFLIILSVTVIKDLQLSNGEYLSIEVQSYRYSSGIQVFTNTGNGYNETESIWGNIYPVEGIQKVDFKLPEKKLFSFRIDTGGTSDEDLYIKSISIYKSVLFNKIELYKFHPDEIVNNFSGYMMTLSKEKGLVLLHAYKGDPHFDSNFDFNMIYNVMHNSETQKKINSNIFLLKSFIFLLVLGLIILFYFIYDKLPLKENFYNCRVYYMMVIIPVVNYCLIKLTNLMNLLGNNRSFFNLNLIEIFIFISAIEILFLLVQKNISSVIKSLGIVLPIIPAIYLSLDSTTQFITVDEDTTIGEMISLGTSGLPNWSQNALRTSDLIIGTIYKFFAVDFTGENAFIFIKALHWLLGFCILLVIFELVYKNFTIGKSKLAYIVFFFYSSLLLPVNTLALKVANYDLLASFLGILAVVYIILGIKNNSIRYIILSIFASTLAAQEKLIASPLLLISMFFYVFIACAKTEESLTYINALKYSIKAGLYSLIISMGTFIFVGIMVRDGIIPKMTLAELLGPMVTFLLPVIRVINAGKFAQIQAPLVLLIFIIFTLSTISYFLKKNDFLKHLASPLFHKNRIAKLFYFSIFLFLLGGIIGTFYIRAYIYPAYPLEKNIYLPPYLMNGNVLHYNMPNALSHKIASVIWSYVVFINAIPTVYLVIIFIIFFKIGTLYFQNKENKLWLFALPLSFLFPLLYGMTDTPVANRYFNLFLFIVVLSLGVLLFNILKDYNKMVIICCTCAFCALLVFEVLSFKPVYGAFRPIWSGYDNKYNSNPVVGQTNPWWNGWGEEVMLAARVIQNLYKEDEKTTINLYYSYPGSMWLNHDPIFQIHPMPPASQMNFSVNDYYIINRSSVVQGWNIPPDIKPLFTISFRGFVQAWVYRGDQLEE